MDVKGNVVSVDYLGPIAPLAFLVLGIAIGAVAGLIVYASLKGAMLGGVFGSVCLLVVYYRLTAPSFRCPKHGVNLVLTDADETHDKPDVYRCPETGCDHTVIQR